MSGRKAGRKRMKIEVCDLCGTQVQFFEVRHLPQAVAILAGAEVVCRDCRDAALRIDWRRIVRERIEEARNG